MIRFGTKIFSINVFDFFLSVSKNFPVSKPLWIDTLVTWTPHLDENGAIVIASENHTLWNSGFRFVALAIGVLIQFVCPTSKKYAIKCSLLISLIFIIFYAMFMGTFHLISWFPFSFIDIIKVSKIKSNSNENCK